MSTIRHIYLLRILLLLTTAAACSCTEKPEVVGPGPIRINASIDNADETVEHTDETTRTSMVGSKASFTAADNIGVFETITGRSNVPFAYNGTAWNNTSTPMYWRNGTAAHTFYAYYPYTAAYSGTTVSMPVLSTQTISTTPNAAYDMLVAGPQSQTRSSSVGLPFKHAFALIQLNVKMGILGLLNPYTLNRITIRGGNTTGTSAPYGIVNTTGTPMQVGYNLASDAVAAATNDAQSYTQSFYSDITGVSLLTTAVTLYAFILPGTYNTPRAAVSFRVTLVLLTSNSTFVNFSNATFQPGMKYVYDVSIGLLSRSEEALNITLDTREVVPINDASPSYIK